MARYVASRVAQGLVVLFGAVTISFLLTNATGNAVDALGTNLDAATRQQLSHESGFDRPVLERFGHYVTGVLHGDFGPSFRSPESALSRVVDAVPYTVGLVAATMLLAVALSVPIALYSVRRRGSLTERGVRRLLMVLQGIPEFFIALILVLVFAVNLRWLPTFGADEPSSFVLPVAALTIPLLSTLVRLLRSQLIEILGREWVLALRTKGINRRAIVMRHALPNAMPPLISYLALQIGWLLGGTLLVEVVFGIPGIGLLAVDSTRDRDVNVVQAIVVVVAVAYVLLNLLADLAIYALDPRIRRTAR